MRSLRWALLVLVAVSVVGTIGCPPRCPDGIENCILFSSQEDYEQFVDAALDDDDIVIIQTLPPSFGDILTINGRDFTGERFELPLGGRLVIDLSGKIVGGVPPFEIEWLIDGQVVGRGWVFDFQPIHDVVLTIRIRDGHGRVIERVITIIIRVPQGNGNDNHNDNGSGNGNNNQNQNGNQNGNDNSGNGNDNGSGQLLHIVSVTMSPPANGNCYRLATEDIVFTVRTQGGSGEEFVRVRTFDRATDTLRISVNPATGQGETTFRHRFIQTTRDAESNFFWPDGRPTEVTTVNVGCVQ